MEYWRLALKTDYPKLLYKHSDAMRSPHFGFESHIFSSLLLCAFQLTGNTTHILLHYCLFVQVTHWNVTNKACNQSQQFLSVYGCVYVLRESMRQVFSNRKTVCKCWPRLHVYRYLLKRIFFSTFWPLVNTQSFRSLKITFFTI